MSQAAEVLPLRCPTTAGDGHWTCMSVYHPEDPEAHYFVHLEP